MLFSLVCNPFEHHLSHPLMRLGIGGARGLVVTSRAVQTESTVGVDLANERVNGETNGDTALG